MGSNLTCIIGILVYVTCWYGTYLLIRLSSPIEEVKLKEKNMLNIIYIIIAALWWLWIVVGIIYGIYYIIKRIR